MTSIAALPEPGDPMHDCLVALAGQLAPHNAIQEPVLSKPAWLDTPLFRELRADANTSMEAGAESHNGKKNAPVSEPLLARLKRARVDEWASEHTGLPLDSEVKATYICYDEPGAALELHLDTRGYSDINLLMCLERTDVRAPVQASATVFVTATGIRRHYYGPGECVIFDGAFLIHGRPPVLEGERVLLLNIGFKLGGEQTR
ncbi:hypothetical protein [Streptosporangium canum]|uniref:hypothetical protein n=1 Tax=Streptosporangium canum TaxID=324952 RepID=UPI00342D9C61